MEQTNQMETQKKQEYRRNLYVFLAIAALTIVEFAIALNLENALVPLMLIALIKAGLIVQFFMHVYRLWRSEDHS